MGWHLRRSGQIPVVLENPKASVRSLNLAVAAIRKGNSLVIFPEGGRSPNGQLQSFMGGAFYAAVKAQVDVVPIVLVGTYEMLKMNSYHIKPGPIQMMVGAPIPTAGMSTRDIAKITEQALGTDDRRAVAHLAGLRALGVQTALTRFGTGSTPLSNLRRLPIDLVKVDRAVFTEPAGAGGRPTPIIEAVVGLSRRLGVQIIAAGLEAEAHLDVVRAAGCRFGQGYLFGRPVPPEHLEAFLETHRSPS